jgi:hypothetical protein
MKTFWLVIFCLLLQVHVTRAQTRTVGLFLNDTALVYEGYTLFPPQTEYHDLPDQQ